MSESLNPELWLSRVPSKTESINASIDFESIWPLDSAMVSIPIIEGRQATGIATYLLARHAVETNRAIRKLFELGMELQAVPLMRVVMESAVTAAWMTITENAGAASLYFVADQRLKALNALQNLSDSNVNSDSEWKSLKESLKNEASSAADNFIQRCESLEGGEGIYAIYRLLSGFSHPNLGLLESYSKPAAEPDGKFSFTDSHLQDQDETFLAFNVCMLALALSAWGKYEETGKLALQVKTLGERFGIRTRISKRQTD